MAASTDQILVMVKSIINGFKASGNLGRPGSKLAKEFIDTKYVRLWDKNAADVELDDDESTTVEDLIAGTNVGHVVGFLETYAIDSIEEDWIGVPSAEHLLESLLDTIDRMYL